MARAVVSMSKRSMAVNFSLPLDLLANLDELAARAGVSRSEFLRGLIEQALEDADDVAVAKERLADEADGWVSLDDLDRTLAAEAKRRMEDSDDEAIPYQQARADLGL